MTFFLFWPDAAELRREGYGSVAHVPCVFNSEWQYEGDVSRYLRERALLEYMPVKEASYRMRAPRYPTEASLRSFGEAITNFLEWCEARQVRWQEVDYTQDLVGRYQKEMLTGAWSVRAKALSASTVNSRINETCRFLSWAAERGLRRPFTVIAGRIFINAPSGMSTHGHKPRQVQQRAGAVRPDPKTLRLPSDIEVEAWHSAVRTERGFTKALICELILKTGIRREEAAQWRIDTLPENRDDWQLSGEYVTVTIKYGTKGSKTADEFGETNIGPSRLILIPLELADRIAEYREVMWPQLRAKYVRAATSTTEKRQRMNNIPRQLFLSDFDGRPLTAKTIYEAWAESSRLPFPGWCPHQGRHYWACKWLLQSINARSKAHVNNISSGLADNGLIGNAMDTIMLQIKPQLGHVSAETSQRYMVWLQRALTLTGLNDDYEKSLEAIALTSFEDSDDRTIK